MRLLILTLCLPLAGCAGLLAGNYTEKPVVLNDGTVAKTAYGTVIKDKKRTARSVSIMESAAEAISGMKDVQPVNNCVTLTFDQINQLKADAQAEYIRSANSCGMFAAFEKVVSQALGRPQSPQEAVARQFVGAVRASENGLTGRIKAIANPLAVTVGIKSVVGGYETIGKAAAENGNISIGTLNGAGSSSQHGGGAEGEAGAASVARDGSESSNIIIGNNNQTNTAQDSGVATIGTNQNLAASATGNVNEQNSNNQGTTNADNIEGSSDGGSTVQNNDSDDVL